MSTINTSVSRAVTGRRFGARRSADRNRAPGGTSLADADQRGGGIFGFPTIGERIERRRARIGGTNVTEPVTAAPTAPLTGGPVASPENVAELSATFPNLGPTELDVAGRQSPEFIATAIQNQSNADSINQILDTAAEPFREFDFFSGELGGVTESSLLGTLANPEAISDEARNAAISAGTETILGRERANAQQLQENLAARGISDSGLSFALAQAGGEASARGIAGIRRDAFLQQELARSAREAEIQRLAASVVGAKGGLDLSAAAGESALLEQGAFGVVDFAGAEAKSDLDLIADAATEEDAERQFTDLLSTAGGGLLTFLIGQAIRAGKPGLAAALGGLGLLGARSIANRET